MKASSVDKSTSYGASRVSPVHSTRLPSTCLAKSYGIVTFSEGSKVPLIEYCKSHIESEIKGLLSALVWVLSSREEIPKDS